MIIKPAEDTPGSCLALAGALDDAGLPKGVLNVVFSVPADIFSYLIGSPVIQKIHSPDRPLSASSLSVLRRTG